MEDKKQIITSKDSVDRLRGIKVTDADREQVAKDLGIEKIPNYVIIGDITLSEHEKSFL